MLLPFARPQTLQTLRRPPRQQLLQLHAPEHLCQLHAPAIYMLLPALKPPKRFQPSRRPPRQQLLQLHAPAICFSGGSRLPFARPQTPQPSRRPPRQQLLQLHAAAICFSGGSSPPSSNPPNASNPPAGLQGNNSYSYMPLPSVFQGVQDCRLPALKPPKTPQTLPQASKATTLTATCP